MKTEPTIRVDIYMAGAIETAKQVCREYCFAVGLCVHVEPVDFIYTGGEEAGFKVGLINYPRFPSSEADIVELAHRLGTLLMQRAHQHSFCVVGSTTTDWVSRRPAQ